MKLKSIGSKAKNLTIINKNSFNVPKFNIIDNYIVERIIFEDIKINKVEIDKFFNSTSLDFIGNIEKKIDSWKPTNEIIRELYSFTKNLKSKKIILRSSNDCEDGNENSFAGIFESEISKFHEENFLKSFKNILKGNFSKRLYYYLKIKKISKFPKIAIIVQEYIEGDISGVIFISDNNLKINYDKGSAKNIVDGKKCHYYSDYYLNKCSPLLNKSQLLELKKTSIKIQKLFNKDQDIEWTFKNKDLYILQTRPITKNISNKKIIWDNSNISESYSGIVLPLTSSYANFIYKEVYINLAISSGVSRKKIYSNIQVFENLLGIFYGRIYYNITNWYTMLTFYPGYKRNKKNFDLMISKKVENELDSKYERNVNFSFKLKYYFKLIFRTPFFNKNVRKFKKDVKLYYKNLRNVNFQKLEIKELLYYYYDFRKKLLSRWHITVESDFLAMSYYGLLRKFCYKNNLSNKMNLLIGDINNVISANQIYHIKNLANQFKKHSKLVELSEKENFLECYNEIISNKKYSKINKELKIYLGIYGGRFANELKLEAENLDSNPEYIINLLLSYSKNYKNVNFRKKAPIEINKLQLNFLKRIILKHLVKKTKFYFKEREEMRLLRSISFSKVREIFLGIGHNLEKNNFLKFHKDIFYLDINEVLNFIEGRAINIDLQNLVDNRKKTYKNYNGIDLENNFETSLMPYIDIEKIVLHQSFKAKNKLNGVPCSEGIIKGKVTILENFRLPRKNEIFEIIVVKNTDPGWTPLFGLCKGLIVEQGGILSHAAIISRELNLPTIIDVKGATKILKDGDIVTLNGINGEIKIG